MEKKFTYKGLLCYWDNDVPILIAKDNKKIYTVPTVIDDAFLEGLTSNKGRLVLFKVLDGTEEITLGKAIENDFEDVIICIKSSGMLEVDENVKLNEYMKDNYENSQEIWTFLEEYFNTEDGKNDYDNFHSENVWNLN